MRSEVQPPRLRPIYRFVAKWTIALAACSAGVLAGDQAVAWYSDISCHCP
jgi:hypothetical protein